MLGIRLFGTKTLIVLFVYLRHPLFGFFLFKNNFIWPESTDLLILIWQKSTDLHVYLADLA